jgi:ABC-type glycerol-3-phosphate transport system substrate-binding protein
MKFITVFLTVAFAASLTACGGGGSAASAPIAAVIPTITPTVVITPAIDLATKYVGKWIACIPATERPGVTVGGTQRVKETLTIIKTGLTSFSYDLLQENLPPLAGGAANLACTGSALSSLKSAGSGSIAGTKSVNGFQVNPSILPELIVVEKLDLVETSPSSGSFTDIAYFSAGSFQLGVNSLSSDGYPNGILFVDYVKQ